MESTPREGDVLALFRRRGTLSRTEVIALSGLSRSTVNERLASLAETGLVVRVEGGESTGGRPSSRFSFNPGRASTLALDIGATGFAAAVCDLSGRVLRHAYRRIDVAQGPVAVLEAGAAALDALQDGAEVWRVAAGLPGPVDFAARQVVKPPIMTGWDRFDVAGWLEERLGAPALVENDANARAVAESKVGGTQNVVALKLGTGIGAGLVMGGRIIRGAKGAAGDIGHTRAQVDAAEGRECFCGTLDCVETYAGGWALARELGQDTTSGIVDLVAAGDPRALRSVRRAGRVIGDATATLVSLLNPGLIALSGRLAMCGEVLLSGIKERVYHRASPLATDGLLIGGSPLGALAGVVGLAHIAADSLFREAPGKGAPNGRVRGD
ncbi:MAG: ROK family transcriptional regulator [Bifidobacteriaceae bacterium]|jgi:predicted NBD/HSP70 family sugar kinase|nr:ROK family transcriptional regulator [Bifidobacteriaceae bacterium]